MFLSILMALLTFLLAKAGGASNKKAALAAGLAGIGTFAYTKYREHQRASLADYEPSETGQLYKWKAKIDPDTGAMQLDDDGNPIYEKVPTSAGDPINPGEIMSALPPVLQSGAAAFTDVTKASTAAKVVDRATKDVNSTVLFIGLGVLAFLFLTK